VKGEPKEGQGRCAWTHRCSGAWRTGTGGKHSCCWILHTPHLLGWSQYSNTLWQYWQDSPRGHGWFCRGEGAGKGRAGGRPY
jgi:hypothetical protein